MNIPESVKPRIVKLFGQLDRAYDEAARRSGFVCNGCRDNCCLTRFYHFTLIEYLYLHQGLQRLTDEQLAAVTEQAERVVQQTADLEKQRLPIRVMCPLNMQGRCILYAHRPMICRLHGLAHVLKRPDGRSQAGPGCDDYYAQCGEGAHHPLDRTPLYTAMADLERKLRQELGFNRKIRMTIAEMIINDSLEIKG